MKQTAAPRLTALSVGHVTRDRYRSRTRIGGCATYGARAFRALGSRSRLVTVAAEDLARDLELDGVEMERGPSAHTTTFENVYPDTGPRQQWVHALAAPVSPDLLPTAWERPDILFLAPVCGEVDVGAWLQAVRAPLVGLSLQGVIKEAVGARAGRSTVGPRPLRLSPAELRRLHVVFTSDEDLLLFGTEGLLGTLCASVPVVVVTSGSSGATVFTSDRAVRVGVHPTTAIDPTGAGDTFAASFLFSMARGDSIIECARFASAAASIVVEGEGGTELGRLGESSSRAERVPLLRASCPPRCA
jgi:hypothetical protein